MSACDACDGSCGVCPYVARRADSETWADVTARVDAGVAHLRRRLAKAEVERGHAVQAERLRTSQLAVQTTRIEAVEKLLASWQDEALYGHIEDRPVSAMRAELLAAALSAAADTDNPEER